jgi:hypothetical protein
MWQDDLKDTTHDEIVDRSCLLPPQDVRAEALIGKALSLILECLAGHLEVQKVIGCTGRIAGGLVGVVESC